MAATHQKNCILSDYETSDTDIDKMNIEQSVNQPSVVADRKTNTKTLTPSVIKTQSVTQMPKEKIVLISTTMNVSTTKNKLKQVNAMRSPITQIKGGMKILAGRCNNFVFR